MEFNTDSRLRIIIEEHQYKEEKEKFGVQYPLYMQCYKDALSAILQNIQYNELADSVGKYGENSFWGEKEGYVAPLDESNIITFIGNRGSGKTTAINEFCRLLGEYHSKNNEWTEENLHKETIGSSKRFHVLTPIDASVLVEEEDLIEVILANMYQAFQQKKDVSRDEHLRNGIINKFDDAYKSYINVGKRANEMVLGESVLVKLRNISGSLKTRLAFDKLIESFLDFLYGADMEKYLVITIDDLDMNPKSGFKMLELLHKYLANRRVIILIAVKYEQINMICRRHFIDCLIPEYGSTHKFVYRKFEKEAKKLSDDYLLKVLPLSNRIYLPERAQLYLNGRVGYKQTPETEWEVKDFVLGKVAAKMGIFYDAKGVKKHFCLPNTVRELVSYNVFLDSLFSMEEIRQNNPDQFMVLYDQNHERFNGDIESRMAEQILNDDQLELYRLIMERNVERRAGYAINFIKSWLENNKQKKKARKRVLITEEADDGNHCYSDLLGILYRLGREDYEDKVLVHCILASFTSEMVREYYSFLYNKNGAARERARSRLKGFLGKTFGGEWFQDMMPFIVYKPGSRIRGGYISDAPLNQVMRMTWCYKKSQENYGDQIIEDLQQIFPYMECLSLLFSNYRDRSGNVCFPEWEFGLEAGISEEGDIITVSIKNNAVFADFDIFGFIGKELGNGVSAKYGKELDVQLAKALENFAVNYRRELGYKKVPREIKSIIKKKMQKRSPWLDDGMREKACFPYYSLDLAYNIMKRVRKRMQEDKRVVVQNIWDYFRGIYGCVAQCLWDEEIYYRDLFASLGQEGQAPLFYQDFVDSPFIRAIGIKCTNEDLNIEGTLEKERFNDVFGQALSGLSSDTKIRESVTEEQGISD